MSVYEDQSGAEEFAASERANGYVDGWSSTPAAAPEITAGEVVAHAVETRPRQIKYMASRALSSARTPDSFSTAGSAPCGRRDFLKLNSPDPAPTAPCQKRRNKRPARRSPTRLQPRRPLPSPGRAAAEDSTGRIQVANDQSSTTSPGDETRPRPTGARARSPPARRDMRLALRRPGSSRSPEPAGRTPASDLRPNARPSRLGLGVLRARPHERSGPFSRSQHDGSSFGGREVCPIRCKPLI